MDGGSGGRGVGEGKSEEADGGEAEETFKDPESDAKRETDAREQAGRAVPLLHGVNDGPGIAGKAEDAEGEGEPLFPGVSPGLGDALQAAIELALHGRPRAVRWSFGGRLVRCWSESELAMDLFRRRCCS